jgi:glycosyltransferase involved in cell wall biosynthesis
MKKKSFRERPMKVLYDYPSSQIHGGISRYACEIIKELCTEIDTDLSIIVTDNLYIKELPFPHIKHLLTKNNFKGKSRIQNFLNLAYTNYKVARNNYDILHVTDPDSKFLVKIKKPLVVTIHDMVNEKSPEAHVSHARQIARKKDLIYSAAQIIAISENTKKDILQLYPVNPDKITVIYHGSPSVPKEIAENKFGKYILFVGRRKRYKNFPFFVESVAPLLLEDKQLKLVCAGPSFTSEEGEFLKTLGVDQQVVAMRVSDNLLYALYRNALAFVFPSLHEGFGIPILEAFASNCPVVLSNTTCFPEIAGDAALYFDPKDKQSIYNSVKKIITDKQLASELRKLGAERVSKYTWSKAAQQTLEVYKSIMA